MGAKADHRSHKTTEHRLLKYMFHLVENVATSDVFGKRGPSTHGRGGGSLGPVFCDTSQRRCDLEAKQVQAISEAANMKRPGAVSTSEGTFTFAFDY